MKTKLDKIQVLLALKGADLTKLDFDTPNALAVSLRRAYKYDEISEQAIEYAKDTGLLAYGGYNKFEVNPMGNWK